MNVMDIEAELAISRHAPSCNGDGAVCRIIQDLNLQKFARVRHIALRLDKPFHNIHFVVDWKLDRHSRLYVQLSLGLRSLVLVLQIEVDEVVSVDPIDGKDSQDRQI